MVRFSVVIPVYGVEKYLDQMFDSIRRQRYENIEYIFVDDGSPDRCPEMLDSFSREDERYKVIHQKNGGVSAARNTGISHATGDYLYIIDSDDWLEDKVFSRIADVIERTGADLIYGDWIQEESSGSKEMVTFPKEFTTEDPETLSILQCASNNNNQKMRVSRPEFDEITHLGGAPWRYFIKRSVVQENDLLYDPYVLGMADDILFTLHLYEYIKSVAYTHVVMYHYRVAGGSLTNAYKADLPERYDRIFSRMEEFLQKYNKDEKAYGAYYMRVLLYLNEGLIRYFKNEGNPKPADERYEEFEKIVRSEPYKTALQKAPIREFSSIKKRIGFYLLRGGAVKLYWLLK